MSNSAEFREYNIDVCGQEVNFENGLIIKSESLANHLSGCNKCAVIAVTLGHETDRQIKKMQFVDMATALELDKKANIDIEAICDSLQKKIESLAKKQDCGITARFSPGYGDLALSYQSAILKLANSKKITITDSFLLIPQKSVTAIIGYKKGKVVAVDKCKNCTLKEKCLTIRQPCLT